MLLIYVQLAGAPGYISVRKEPISALYVYIWEGGRGLNGFCAKSEALSTAMADEMTREVKDNMLPKVLALPGPAHIIGALMYGRDCRAAAMRPVQLKLSCIASIYARRGL